MVRSTVLIAFLLALLPASANAFEPPPGWVVKPTPHSYKALIGRVDQAAKDNKMGIVSRASATVGAKKVLDKTIPGNADGTADLSYKLPSAVFAPYEDGGDKLKALAAELDGVFAAIVEQASAP
jgi:hypothetical protein